MIFSNLHSLCHSGQQSEKLEPHISIQLLMFFLESYFNKPGNKSSYSLNMGVIPCV